MNVYVADPLNNRIRRITQGDEGTVVTVAGSARGFADGKGAQAQLFMPEGIAISPVDGAIFVADSGNNRIRKIVLSVIFDSFRFASSVSLTLFRN